MCSKWSPVIWFSFSWQPLWQRDFPRMGAMISPIIHSFVTSFLSRGRVYVPCLWIWDSLWLMQNWHHKIQFMPGSLGMLNLGTQSPCYAESTREVHMCLADSSSLHQSAQTLEWRCLQEVSAPSCGVTHQLLSPSRRDLRHYRAKASCSHCDLSRFLNCRAAEVV